MEAHRRYSSLVGTQPCHLAPRAHREEGKSQRPAGLAFKLGVREASETWERE